MNKKLFIGLVAISAGILIAIGTMAWTNPTNNPPIGSGAGFFPSGTQIVFFQASCPSGWTQNAGYNDLMMRIVSGAGGGTGGSWTISGLSSVADHSHLTPDHAHNLAVRGKTILNEFAPTWEETIFRNVDEFQNLNYSGSGSVQGTYYIPKTYTTTFGGGTSGNAGSHSHPSDASWRPAYLNAIICQKN